MVWLSPAFPVGAFAYSHGLEWAQEAGDLTDAASLQAWLADLLVLGAPRNDTILFAEAFRAVEAGSKRRLAAVAEMALALASSAERTLETTTQGDAFVAAVARSWPTVALDPLESLDHVAYPIAVATAAAGHGIPLGPALEAFGLGFVQNLVSAAVRLGVVGQTDGHRIVAALIPAVRELAAFGAESTLDDLGSAAFRSDLAALRHETQYSRLFRS